MTRSPMTPDPPERRPSSRLPARAFLGALGAAFGGLVFIGCAGAAGGGSPGTATFFDRLARSPWTPVVAIVGSLVLSALFAMGESAVNALRPHHLKRLPEGTPLERRLTATLERRAEIAAALSFGGQLARVGLVLSGFLLALFLATWGQLDNVGAAGYGPIVLAALAVALPLALLNLFLGDLAPRSFGAAHPLAVVTRMGTLVRVTSLLLGFPARALVGWTERIRRAFAPKGDAADAAQEKEEEIRTLVESAEESGAIESDEKELITSVFEFTDTVAREVMTPRTDLDAMPIESDPKEIVEVIQRTGHSRIPLYEGTDDAIVGIVHAKDLLLAMVSYKPVSLRKLMRHATFVTETKSLHELLREMRAGKSQLAVVQDEFGGTAGIVTIEDIIEELVGEIQDEYDMEEPAVNETPEGYLVEGKTHIDDVNEEVGSRFASDDFDTIGGYVFGLFGRQPRAGESIEAEGFLFTVAETDGKRILKLRMEPCDPSSSNDDYRKSA